MKLINLLFAFLIAITCAAHPGIGIVMNSEGTVFYTDLTHVWKINTHGVKSIAVRNVHTHELYLDNQDNLFGEHLSYEGSIDKWSHYVWRLASDGKFEKIKPETEGFLENYSFVRDHQGRMYWADRSGACQKIARKDRNNLIERMGDKCFRNIRNIHLAGDGFIYVIDFQDLVKVDRQGHVTPLASGIANKAWTHSNVDNQNAVMGVWDDRQGNIYTAILSSRLVKKFDKNGKEEIVFQTSAPWSPTGGMISSTGELWILETSDTNEVRVERILDGHRRIVY
jgi:hypothetical protein